MIGKTMAVLLLLMSIGFVIWGGTIVFEADEYERSLTHLQSRAGAELIRDRAYEKFGQAFGMFVVAGMFGAVSQVQDEVAGVKRAIGAKRLLQPDAADSITPAAHPPAH